MSKIQPESLVKYETAILVSSSFKSKSDKTLPKVITASSRTEDYLNSILPPQEIVEQGQLWVRYVSATPATTADVTNLVKDLDKRLLQMEARDTGICPIREELYSQVFDEVIRQITINCAERGYLLLRVRDEMRMVKQALQGLYDSSIAYGMKKALVSQHNKANMNAKIVSLRAETQALEAQCQDFEAQAVELVNIAKAEDEKLAASHNEEKLKYRQAIILLKFDLDKCLSTKVT